MDNQDYIAKLNRYTLPEQILSKETLDPINDCRGKIFLMQC